LQLEVPTFRAEFCCEGLGARNLRNFGVHAKLAKCMVWVSSDFSRAPRKETLSG
jgi:hypothetical protein